MSRFANQYKKRVIKEMGLKLGCFTGFYHHPVTTMSAHTHAHRYPLFEIGTKTDPCTIA